jgi:hypothetical protein
MILSKTLSLWLLRSQSAAMKLVLLSAAALLLVSGCCAQNNFTRTDSGIPHTVDATAQSKQITVAANGGVPPTRLCAAQSI